MTNFLASSRTIATIARTLACGAVLAMATQTQAAIGWAPRTPIAPPVAARPPYAGLPNFGSETPQYRWGWFGAEHQTRPSYWHNGHMGKSLRWHYR